MLSFLTVSLISVLLIFLSSLLTYEVLRAIWSALPRLNMPMRLRVAAIMLPIFACHIAGIWLYAAAYFLIEHFTSVGHLVGNGHTVELSYTSFIDCLYFSASTYTSLGFGDILPTRDMRMLSSAEVLNGLLMIGWTISFTYLVMERFWRLPAQKKRKDAR